MKFHEVSKAMDKGKKIKLKDWDNAYWYKKGGIIINHLNCVYRFQTLPK